MEEKNSILELDYYTGSHEILLDTLNNCSISIKNIINEICKINNINDVEILLLPYECGSFKQVIKFAKDIRTFSLKCLIFKILIIDNLPSIDLNLNLNIGKNNVQTIGNSNTININKDSYNTINKNRSNFYNVLKNDKYISKYNGGKLELSYYDNDKLISSNINKSEFDKFIICNNEKELTIFGDGFITLKTVVLDSNSNNQWNGIYCGKDIVDIDNNILVPVNSQIGFYILDKNFKKQIEAKQIHFSSNDKIYVKYKIIYTNINHEIKILRFEVLEVLEFNNNIFQVYKKEQADNSLNELPLFSLYNKNKKN